MTAEEKAQIYKGEALRMLELKRQWKNRAHAFAHGCSILGVIAIVLAVSLLAEVNRPRLLPAPIPAGDVDDPTPGHILAVIKIGGCSATVFAQGESFSAAIGAAHCVASIRGGRLYAPATGTKFWAGNCAGQAATAELLEIDAQHDLAIFRVPNSLVLGVANIPNDLPPAGSVREAVGYTAGQGPIYKRLADIRSNAINAAWDQPLSNGDRWQCTVTSGRFWGGDSGGAVFIDGQLCGVISNRGGNSGTMQQPTSNDLFCCPHKYVREFAEQCSKRRDWNCGDGFCEPRQQPGYVPPRDLAPAPDQPQPQKPPAPQQPGWKPSPNIQIRLPGQQQAPPTPDQLLKSDKGQAVLIQQLFEQIAKLQQANADQVAKLTEQFASLHTQIGGIAEKPVDPNAGKILQQLDELRHALETQPQLGAPDINITALQQALQQTVQQTVTNSQQPLVEKLLEGIHAKIGGEASASAPAPGAGATGLITLGGWLLPILLGGSGVAGMAGTGGFFALKALYGWWKSKKTSKASTPATSSSRSAGPGGPAIDAQRIIEQLLAKLQQQGQGAPAAGQTPSSDGHTTAPAPRPYPILSDSPPPPPQIITESVFTPIERNTFAEAYAWSKAAFARKYPNQAEPFFGVLDSFINQHLAGQGVKNANVSK